MKKLVSALICLAAFSILPCRGEPITALTSNNLLLFFDSLTPGTITRSVAVTGLQGGEMLIGMDYRLANGGLYAVSTNSRLYQLDETTGAATAIGSADGFTINPLSGGYVGFNFNPVVDRIRLVTVNQNIRINPDTGALAATDTPTSYVPGDPHAGALGGAPPVAYTNNFLGAKTTTLYGISPTYDTLIVQDPPNSGSLHTLGPMGVDTGLRAGFDISGTTGTAYVCLSVGSVPTLFTINLGTGAVTNVGRISTALFLGTNTINAISVPTATRVLNLATRGIVSQGESVLIGGFIARGAAPTKLVIRGIGPSLSAFFPGALGNPKLEIFDSNGVSIKSNDNWHDAPEAEYLELIQVGLQPMDDLESAVLVTLPPGGYTAVVSSVDPNSGGVALVEIYLL